MTRAVGSTLETSCGTASEDKKSKAGWERLNLEVTLSLTPYRPYSLDPEPLNPKP